MGRGAGVPELIAGSLPARDAVNPPGMLSGKLQSAGYRIGHEQEPTWSLS